MVIQGTARFYGEGDFLLAGLGAHEEVVMPHGFNY